MLHVSKWSKSASATTDDVQNLQSETFLFVEKFNENYWTFKNRVKDYFRCVFLQKQMHISCASGRSGFILIEMASGLSKS
jgi:hypothetical protein